MSSFENGGFCPDIPKAFGIGALIPQFLSPPMAIGAKSGISNYDRKLMND